VPSFEVILGWRTELFRGDRMGFFKTIDLIAGSPIRSRAWKIIDVAFLCTLWAASIASVVIWLDGNAFTTWSVIVRILVPMTLLVTARSWYRHPKLSKRARENAARRAALESAWVPPTDQIVNVDQSIGRQS
jgi:hypothetical protein